MNQQEYIDSLLNKIETLEATIRNYEEVIDNEPRFDAEEEFFSMDEDDIKTFLYGPRAQWGFVLQSSAVKED